jgi:hypothetical protein
MVDVLSIPFGEVRHLVHTRKDLSKSPGSGRHEMDVGVRHLVHTRKGLSKSPGSGRHEMEVGVRHLVHTRKGLSKSPGVFDGSPTFDTNIGPSPPSHLVPVSQRPLARSQRPLSTRP